MAKGIIIGILTLYSFSSAAQKLSNKVDSDKILEFYVEHIVKYKSNILIEFPNIYDSLATVIQEDKSEILIIAEILKRKGFTVTIWARGNMPPRGPRIVTLTMDNNDCRCEVSKIYYNTIDENHYELAERIKCYRKTNME